MTMFIRLLVVDRAEDVDDVVEHSKSSIEILFLMALYNIFWRVVRGQYTRISIWNTLHEDIKRYTAV